MGCTVAHYVKYGIVLLHHDSINKQDEGREEEEEAESQ